MLLLIVANFFNFGNYYYQTYKMSGMSKVTNFSLLGTSDYNLYYAAPITLIFIPLFCKWGKNGLLLPLNLLMPAICYACLINNPLYYGCAYWKHSML